MTAEMTEKQCPASSDDLGCYEFSGGFMCQLNQGHMDFHRAETDTYVVLWEIKTNSKDANG